MSRIKKMTLEAMFAAIYVVLSFMTIRLGNVSITLAPLPIILMAVLFGPLPAAASCLIGEAILQFALYGFSPTTPIWMIGPVLRPLFVGLMAKLVRNIERKPAIFLSTAVFGSVLTTTGNTLALWLDSLIVGYPYEFVVVETLIRLGVGILAAALLGLAAMPCVRALKKPAAEKEFDYDR